MELDERSSADASRREVPLAGRELNVRAVERAIAILNVLVPSPNSQLAEIARAAELSEATTLRYLNTMRRYEWVVVDRQRRYQLGPRLFELGQRAVGQLGIRMIALPHMEALLAEYEETVNLAMRNDRDVIIIEVLEGTRAIKRGAKVGERDVWHASGLGKAILAWLPSADVDSILEDDGLAPLTPRTCTNRARLDSELGLIRSQGFAVDDEEASEDVRCVAAPIFDHRDRPVYALSVSGLASRLSTEMLPAIGARIKSAADAVSSALGYRSEAGLGGEPA